MSQSEAQLPDRRKAAHRVFEEYLRSRPERDGEASEQLCARHPDLAEELEKLFSVFQLAQAALGSRSFQDSLRQQLGEHAELTIELDEESGSGCPPAGRSEPGPSPGLAVKPGPGRRYSVESELARGGMGVIWRVRDHDLSRTLAMKVMASDPARSSVKEPASRINLARFVEEAQVTAQLDHPGIVPVHEIGFDAQGRPFFTMKLVKGCDLDEVFGLAREEKERWNLPRVVGVLVKACQALAYAHSKGVIHRDLKPANIMVGRFGEVYLMDWGLAKIIGRKDLHDIRPRDEQFTASIHSPRRDSTANSPDSPLITMDGSVVGTPAYMPPEQARGQVVDVDQTSDIYSLGAILYHLLTGRTPYLEPGARISPHTILARVLDGPPRPVHLLNPEAPPELIAICEKAMAREKPERYASSLDLAEDMQAFLDRRVVRAYRTGALAEFRSWVARNKITALVAGGAVLLVMGLFLFGAAWERAKALDLRESLARQYLRRGQSLCEQGEVSRGLHWLARSIEEAPESSSALREAIEQNLAAWGGQWKRPRAVLHHDSMVYAVALSPDGKRAVTGNHNGIVRFWSAETGEPLDLTVKLAGAIYGLQFSRDGRRLLIRADQVVHLCDVDGGKLLCRLETGETPVHLAILSPDGRRVATGARDGSVQVFAAETGKPSGPRGAHESPGGVNSLAFSPDGRQLLTSGDDHTARLWNGETGESLGSPLAHRDPVLTAVFSPDGGRMATVSAGIVQIWSAGGRQPLGAPLRHPLVERVTFSPDGRRLLSGGADRSARLWDPLTGEPVGAPLLHEGTVFALIFSPDGRRALTAGEGGAIRFWSAETGDSLAAPLRHGGAVWEICLSPDGRTLLARVNGHAQALWSVELEEQPRAASVLPGHIIAAVAFSPDGRQMLLGTRGGQVWWWPVGSAEASLSTMKHDRGLWFVVFSSDGKRVLTGDIDRVARIWSLDEGERLLSTLVHDGEVRSGVFSLDGKLVATASFDHQARLWSADSGRQLGLPLEHPNMVEDVAFSPDGRLLATACGDGSARLWSVETDRQVGPAMMHRSSVLAVKFSPDGLHLVTGSRDGTARFWSVATSRPTLLLEHRGWVEDLCFSADGSRIATVSSIDGIRIWSTETGEQIGPPLEDSAAWQVVFSPDGARIAASILNRPVRLWTLPPPLQVDLREAKRWVEVLTWQEMDANGVLTWLDRPSWLARRAEIDRLKGKTGN